jgi:CRP-like cAMP-binding protein
MTPNLIQQYLARSPVLADTPESVLAAFASQAHTRELRRGQVLWRAGDQPLGLVVLINGLIKVVRTNAAGHGVLCACFGAPQSVGDAALIRGIPYPAQAIVATPRASIVWVPAPLFLSEMQRRPEIGLAMSRNLHVKLVALHDKIDVLSAGSVESRLATTLLSLAERYGDELEDGACLIPVALSRRELADWVSTSTETVVRVMKRWERAGVLDTTRHGFHIRAFAPLRAARGDGIGTALTAE